MKGQGCLHTISSRDFKYTFVAWQTAKCVFKVPQSICEHLRSQMSVRRTSIGGRMWRSPKTLSANSLRVPVDP